MPAQRVLKSAAQCGSQGLLGLLEKEAPLIGEEEEFDDLPEWAWTYLPWQHC